MYASNLFFFNTPTSSGDKALLCTGNGRTLWMYGEAALSSPAKLLNTLARNGLPITDQDPSRALAARLATAKPYDGLPPVDRPGWHDKFFVWPDGSVDGPEGSPKPEGIFEPVASVFQKRGTLRRWQRTIAERLARQPLLVFQILLPLASIIRPLTGAFDDLFFEVVAQHTELAALHYITGSVTGGIDLGGAYQAVRFHEALSSSAHFDPFADHLLLVNDAEFFFASRAAAMRANETRRLLSREIRAIMSPGTPSRLMELVGRQRLSELVGADSDIGRLVAERVITLKVPPDRQHGIFESLPKNLQFATQWTARLRVAAEEARGSLLHAFVKRAVQERANDPQALVRRINRRVLQFRVRSGVDQHNHAAVRVADAFGLIYAAGRLAEQWDLLPSKWRSGRVLHCYERFYLAPAPPMSFDDELVALANAPDAVHVTQGEEQIDAERIAAAEVIVLHRRTGRELYIRPAAIARRITNWHHRRNDPQVLARLKRDGRHFGVKAPRLIGGAERIYGFNLPDDEGGATDA